MCLVELEPEGVKSIDLLSREDEEDEDKRSLR